MQNNVFISNSINEAINLYLSNREKEYSIEYNSFLCSVFRMLTIIFDEGDLIASYFAKNSEKFDNCLMKYGLDVESLDNFKVNFEKYYKFNAKQANKTIKKKNKYFNLVQKSIIDMMALKKETSEIDDSKLEEFYNLLFTANSKDFYRQSVAVLEAYNPYEIDNYAKKRLLGVEV